jgi:hypothetical protein
MKKRYREDLSIGGSLVVVVDYSQMLATTLYALAGHASAAQDP